MIKWPELRFPPINLWSNSAHIKSGIDVLRDIANDFDSLIEERFASLEEQVADNGENIKAFIRLGKQIKELEFIYYTRTGRFPD